MNEDKQKKEINPDVLKWIIIGLLCFVGVILIFSLGMWVGGERARFSYGWAENYHKNFGGPRPGFGPDWQNFPKQDFIEGHGVFGKIIEIKENGFVIKDKDDTEKIVVIKEGTVIKRLRDTIQLSDLKIDDFVVIIGSPNDQGQIEAELIRIMPPQDLGFMPGPRMMR